MDPTAFFDQLENGIDAAWSEYVQELQAQLTSRAPIDTGRLASSFYISKTIPSNALRPENWAPPGAKKQVLPEYTGKIAFDGTWFITNNVPYAVRVAKDPVYGKNGRGFGSEWYNATVTQKQKTWEAIVAKNLRKLK
jgi:hypothetical protein